MFLGTLFPWYLLQQPLRQKRSTPVPAMGSVFQTYPDNLGLQVGDTQIGIQTLCLELSLLHIAQVRTESPQARVTVMLTGWAPALGTMLLCTVTAGPGIPSPAETSCENLQNTVEMSPHRDISWPLFSPPVLGGSRLWQCHVPAWGGGLGLPRSAHCSVLTPTPVRKRWLGWIHYVLKNCLET